MRQTMEISDGRKISKQQLERRSIEKVKEWLRSRDNEKLVITKQLCINELDLSKTTVYKHWDKAIKELNNEN